jgi:hypothetical protein
MKQILLATGLLALPCAVSSTQSVAQVPANKQDDPRLERLREFFAEYDSPLSSAAAEFLLAADENGLDWRLLPSISIVESGGGKVYINNNVLGWDSARKSFASVEDGIRAVAGRLANSKLYKNKDLDSLLNTYNPVPNYPDRVKVLMRALSEDMDGEVARLLPKI